MVGYTSALVASGNHLENQRRERTPREPCRPRPTRTDLRRARGVGLVVRAPAVTDRAGVGDHRARARHRPGDGDLGADGVPALRQHRHPVARPGRRRGRQDPDAGDHPVRAGGRLADGGAGAQHRLADRRPSGAGCRGRRAAAVVRDRARRVRREDDRCPLGAGLAHRRRVRLGHRDRRADRRCLRLHGVVLAADARDLCGRGRGTAADPPVADPYAGPAAAAARRTPRGLAGRPAARAQRGQRVGLDLSRGSSACSPRRRWGWRPGSWSRPGCRCR